MLSKVPAGLQVSEDSSMVNLDLSIIPVRNEGSQGSQASETLNGGAPKIQTELFSTSGPPNVMY